MYINGECQKALQWAVLSTKESFSFAHMDTAGVGTLSKLLCGKKMWVLHHPRCDRKSCAFDVMYSARFGFHKSAERSHQGSRSCGCIIIVQEPGDIM